MDWQDISTAPKDRAILLYGALNVLPANRELYGDLTRPARATGYWDDIDEAWGLVGGTWEGPWIDATHWMPLPPPPTEDTE